MYPHYIPTLLDLPKEPQTGSCVCPGSLPTPTLVALQILRMRKT